MAVKLSSYYWFRNNYLVRSLEDKACEKAFFGSKGLSSQDRRILKFIVDELDELKEDSHFQQGRPLISKHAILQNVVELKDVTSDPELAAAYFQGIHKIMEKYWVDVELYRQLGSCFEELGLQPNSDVAEAVKYANNKIAFDRYRSGSMCWQDIKK